MKNNIIALALLILIILPLFGDEERGIKLKISQLDKNYSVGKQYLVLIAIDKYGEWHPLSNPVKDALEIKEIIRSRYYIDEVFELYDKDATKANILRLFNDLKSKLNEEDSLIVFYAGHGYLDDNTNIGYWIPVNGGVDEFEQSNWISNNQVRGIISNLRASHICLIVDSCFSGDILDTIRGANISINNEYFKKAYNKISRQALTSGALETVPDVSEFAQQLKLVLKKDINPFLDPLMIYNEIRSNIKKTMPLFGNLKTSGHQEGGSFLFFRKDEIGMLIVNVLSNGLLYIDDKYYQHVKQGEITLNGIEAGTHLVKIVYGTDEIEEYTISIEKDSTSHISFTWEKEITEQENMEEIYNKYQEKLKSLEELSSSGGKIKNKDVINAENIYHELLDLKEVFPELLETAELVFYKIEAEKEIQDILDTKENLVSLRSGLEKEYPKQVKQKNAFNAWKWVCLGLGTASFSGMGITLYLGNESYNQYSDAIYTDDAITYREDVEFYSNMSVAGGSIGAALITTGVILWFLAPKPGQIKTRIHNIDLQIEMLDNKLNE